MNWIAFHDRVDAGGRGLPPGRLLPGLRHRLLALALLPLVTGCSIRGMAVSAVADGLSGTGDTFASDDDPELVRDAVPFALKTYEALLAERPEHRGLLLASARGFTQYAWAFVETDALLLEGEDRAAARSERIRARNLYLRARDYGLRALELERPGTGEALHRDPRDAADRFGFEGLQVA